MGLIGERLGLGELGQYESPTTTTGGGGEVGLGIQQDGEEIQSKTQVEDREWRETVRNLLLVVDGMVSVALFTRLYVSSIDVLSLLA